MPNPTAKLIFVVGCPRSGTSLFSELLATAGLQTIDSSNRTADYPSGYYEYLPLQMFNKAIERLSRGADHRATTDPFLKSDYLADEFIHTMFRSAWAPILNRSVDFIKFPQLALSIDFLFEQFPDIHVIALWRDPVCTFRSLVTKEFPSTMIPASGLKAVLLWNTYAYHIVQAHRKRSEGVTVLSIDHLVKTDSSITPLLRLLGYDTAEEYTLSQCIRHGVWTERTSWPWMLYFQSMRLGMLAARRQFLDNKAALADLSAWQTELIGITTAV